MQTDTIILLLLALAAPVCMLVGAAAGALLTYRLMTGKAPIPSPFRGRASVHQPPAADGESRRYPMPRS